MSRVPNPRAAPRGLARALTVHFGPWAHSWHMTCPDNPTRGCKPGYILKAFQGCRDFHRRASTAERPATQTKATDPLNGYVKGMTLSHGSPNRPPSCTPTPQTNLRRNPTQMSGRYGPHVEFDLGSLGWSIGSTCEGESRETHARSRSIVLGLFSLVQTYNPSSSQFAKDAPLELTNRVQNTSF